MEPVLFLVFQQCGTRTRGGVSSFGTGNHKLDVIAAILFHGALELVGGMIHAFQTRDNFAAVGVDVLDQLLRQSTQERSNHVLQVSVLDDFARQKVIVFERLGGRCKRRLQVRCSLVLALHFTVL